MRASLLGCFSLPLNTPSVLLMSIVVLHSQKQKAVVHNSGDKMGIIQQKARLLADTNLLFIVWLYKGKSLPRLEVVARRGE